MHELAVVANLFLHSAEHAAGHFSWVGSRPSSERTRPNLDRYDQCRQTSRISNKLGPFYLRRVRTNVARFGPHLGGIRPNSGYVRPSLGNVRPNLGRHQQHLAELGQIWAETDRTRPKLAVLDQLWAAFDPARRRMVGPEGLLHGECATHSVPSWCVTSKSSWPAGVDPPQRRVSAVTDSRRHPWGWRAEWALRVRRPTKLLVIATTCAISLRPRLAVGVGLMPGALVFLGVCRTHPAVVERAAGAPGGVCLAAGGCDRCPVGASTSRREGCRDATHLLSSVVCEPRAYIRFGAETGLSSLCRFSPPVVGPPTPMSLVKTCRRKFTLWRPMAVARACDNAGADGEDKPDPVVTHPSATAIFPLATLPTPSPKCAIPNGGAAYAGVGPPCGRRAPASRVHRCRVSRKSQAGAAFECRSVSRASLRDAYLR